MEEKRSAFRGPAGRATRVAAGFRTCLRHEEVKPPSTPVEPRVVAGGTSVAAAGTVRCDPAEPVAVYRCPARPRQTHRKGDRVPLMNTLYSPETQIDRRASSS